MLRNETDKPAKLLDRAQAIFLKNGFANASLREIAQEAGMTTGAVYHYFSGKDELFVEVCLHGYQILLKRLDAAAKLTEGQPAASCILAFLDAYFAFFLENGEYFELIEQFDREAESLKIAPDLRQRVREASRRTMDRIRAALGDSSPKAAVKAELVAALGHGMVQRMRSGALDRASVTFGDLRQLYRDVIQQLVPPR